MASSKGSNENLPATTTDAPVTVGYDPSDFEWENVHEEAPDQIVFDTLGDTYVGRYLGSEVIDISDEKNPEKSFTQLRFRDPEGLKVTNAGYELREAFEKIPADTMVRIQLIKFVEVGQNDPMKSYRVDVAKNTPTA